LIEMIHILEDCTGCKAKLKFLPVPEGDITHTCADITKASDLLNFSPQVSFSEGMQKFVEWYKSVILKNSLSFVNT